VRSTRSRVDVSAETSDAAAERCGWVGTLRDVLAPSTLCVECDAVVGDGWDLDAGVRPHEFHAGPRCENASDGAAVKGAASAVREAQAEGPTLTGATPMRPSWRVREGSHS